MTPTWIGCAGGNWAAGRRGQKPLGIVIHIMDGTLSGTDAWFNTTPAARNNGNFASSAHYGIGKTGTVHQYVDEPDEAFHAGRVQNPTTPLVSQNPGVNPNVFTVGIEHEGTVDDDWSDEMVQASVELVADICKRWSIPCDRDHIVKHHEIFAPKPCPGPTCPIDDIVAKAAAIIGGAP